MEEWLSLAHDSEANGRPLWGRHGREAPTVVATVDMGTSGWQTGGRELWPELETVNSAQNSLPKGPWGTLAS